MWVSSNSRDPSLMRSHGTPLRVGACSGIRTYPPSPEPTSPLHRSLSLYGWYLSTSSLSEAIKARDWTIEDKLPEICRVHAPPRHRMGDTTRHLDNTRGVEPASQLSPPHTQGSDEITSLRKLPLHALLGKIGGVGGMEVSQRAAEIEIIGGFLASTRFLLSRRRKIVKCCRGWWRCNITLRMGYLPITVHSVQGALLRRQGVSSRVRGTTRRVSSCVSIDLIMIKMPPQAMCMPGFLPSFITSLPQYSGVALSLSALLCSVRIEGLFATITFRPAAPRALLKRDTLDRSFYLSNPTAVNKARLIQAR